MVVKEIKVNDSSKREIERAKQEVLNEVLIESDLGDHPGIPHLVGACSLQAPFYLVLQHLAVEGYSITPSKAAATAVLPMLLIAPKFLEKFVRCCCLCIRG